MYKSFNRQDLVYFTIILVSIVVLNGIFIHSNDERRNLKKILKDSKVIEAISIGSSHSAAIDFPTIGLKGELMAMGGRDLSETKFYLEYLLDRLPNLRYIFIPVSYFTFFSDNNVLSSGLTDSRIEMYKAIPGFTYLKNDFNNFLVAKCFAFIQEDHWKGVCQNIFLKESSVANRTTDLEPTITWLPDSINIQSRVLSVELRNKTCLEREPEIVKRSVEKIKEIISLAKRKGITVIFFTPPYYHLYSGLFSKAYIRQMDSIMNSISIKYNVKYINSSADSSFAVNSTLFLNEDHLNTRGKKLYSKKMKQYLGL